SSKDPISASILSSKICTLLTGKVNPGGVIIFFEEGLLGSHNLKFSLESLLYALFAFTSALSHTRNRTSFILITFANCAFTLQRFLFSTSYGFLLILYFSGRAAKYCFPSLTLLTIFPIFPRYSPSTLFVTFAIILVFNSRLISVLNSHLTAFFQPSDGHYYFSIPFGIRIIFIRN